MSQPELHLSAIVVYPVKSLAGISVTAWPVEATGLRYDRQWMLVDDQGQFLSQRHLPAMALIKTALNGDRLHISADGHPDWVLPLSPASGDVIACRIWEDTCQGRLVSAAADVWFSAVLQHSCRLVYLPDEQIRAVDPDYAAATDRTAFSDGFPFLLVAENSLAELNALLPEPISMARFRPNLVVAGCPGYAEDKWRQIRIGTLGFRLPKPCSRCAIPTIDPNTGQPGKEPLTTLNRTRKWQNKVYFGQNALHDGLGVLQVGDKVEVLLAGEALPPV
jgi:hypothetical protein